MGFAKSKWMEDEANGFNSGSDIYVCAKHFDDKGIQSFIRHSLQNQKCHYCEAKKSASIDDVLKHIMDCVNVFYDDPSNGDGNWDGEAHEWAEEYPDTHDLLFEEIGLNVEPYELQEDISNLLSTDHLWCERDPYGNAEDDFLFYNWEYFCEYIKYKCRYVFYKTKVRRDIYSDKDDTDPSQILNDIGNRIHKLKLYKKIEKGTVFYRARQHALSEVITKGSNLSSPPKKSAKSNRFSPAGIPMFYGAEDEETAIKEAIYHSVDSPVVTVGKFKNLSELNLIDLTNIPVVSMFDSRQNKNYLALAFLRRFVKDISKSITPDGSEHIDYVPTQVITEYFRHIMSNHYGIKIDGIQYRSIKNQQSVCYVLFLDEHQSTQDNDGFENDKVLCLELSSLNKIDVIDFEKEQKLKEDDKLDKLLANIHTR